MQTDQEKFSHAICSWVPYDKPAQDALRDLYTVREWERIGDYAYDLYVEAIGALSKVPVHPAGLTEESSIQTLSWLTRDCRVRAHAAARVHRRWNHCATIVILLKARRAADRRRSRQRKASRVYALAA